MVFRSAVDWWYYAVLATVAGALLLSLGPALLNQQTSLLTAVGLFIVALGLPVWLLLATHYTVEADTLVVRSGPFTWRVPVNEIEAVKATRSPLSSPALSLDRLEVSYSGGKRILLSPDDRQGFLEAIGQANDGR